MLYLPNAAQEAGSYTCLVVSLTFPAGQLPLCSNAWCNHPHVRLELGAKFLSQCVKGLRSLLPRIQKIQQDLMGGSAMCLYY